ncbi:MAG TPA: uracil-DNA glycosylase [bacterium]|nr:uracil-DNA glycosylase [bacterium]HPN30798.1 uracil-DNA glycosylase [bacterium]
MSNFDFKTHLSDLKKYSDSLAANKSKSFIFSPSLKNDFIRQNSKITEPVAAYNQNIEKEYGSTFPDNLNQLKNEILNCEICPLKNTRKNAIFGTGSFSPKILFISKSPKPDDDSSGVPLRGEAGLILEKIIKNVLMLEPEDVFITNLLRCIIPENAEGLTKSYIDKCKHYTFRLIEFLNPAIICLLGNETFKTVLSDQIKKNDGIADFHGKIFYYKQIPVIATFSLYALIKNDPGKEKRRIVFEDMKKIKELSEKILGGGDSCYGEKTKIKG